MLEIKMVNPQLIDKFVLRETAKFLLALAGDHLVAEQDMPVTVTHVQEPESYIVGEEVPENSYEPEVEAITFGGNEKDIKGLPWDHRIHARTRTKTADGAWKLMRGVDGGLVKKIEAELAGALNAPAVPAVPAVPVEQPVVPIPPVPSAPAVTEVDTNSAWFTAMAKITTVVKEGQMTHAQVMTIVKSMGLESIPLIAQRPDLIPAILHRIDYFLQNGQFLQ